MDILEDVSLFMITPPTYLNYQGKVINFSQRYPCILVNLL